MSTAPTVANQVGKLRQCVARKGGLSNAEREELNRLRRENRQLKMERHILAKATAWFAKKGDPTSTPSSSS